MNEKEQILEIVGSEEELNNYLEFLDGLKGSGKVNMWEAGVYIQKTFGVAGNEAHKILTYWMYTFSERHPA